MKTIAFDTKTFNKWRSQRGETTLKFEFISPNYTVDNFTYRKQTHEMSVLLRESRDYTLKLGFSEPIFEITHSSDLPDIYMEVHDYMSYVND